jgi:AcrR family transcriptional regulator
MTSQEKILTAAQELFGEFGFAETTFKRIADKAGVAPGLITHHFGTKEKLFAAASLNVLTSLRDRAMAAAEAESSGLEAVVAYVSTYLKESERPGAHFPILVQCSPYGDVKSGLDKADIVRTFEELIHELARCLIRGMKDGSVVECESATRTADVIFSTLVGTVRTKLLAPFCNEGFYQAVLNFIRRAVASDSISSRTGGVAAL